MRTRSFAILMQAGALHFERHGGLVMGNIWRIDNGCPGLAWIMGPAGGVVDDLQDLLVVVSGVGLMAGAEIEDPARTPLVGEAGTEHFATFKP